MPDLEQTQYSSITSEKNIDGINTLIGSTFTRYAVSNLVNLKNTLQDEEVDKRRRVLLTVYYSSTSVLSILMIGAAHPIVVIRMIIMGYRINETLNNIANDDKETKEFAKVLVTEVGLGVAKNSATWDLLRSTGTSNTIINNTNISQVAEIFESLHMLLSPSTDQNIDNTDELFRTNINKFLSILERNIESFEPIIDNLRSTFRHFENSLPSKAKIHLPLLDTILDEKIDRQSIAAIKSLINVMNENKDKIDYIKFYNDIISILPKEIASESIDNLREPENDLEESADYTKAANISKIAYPLSVILNDLLNSDDFVNSVTNISGNRKAFDSIINLYIETTAQSNLANLKQQNAARARANDPSQIELPLPSIDEIKQGVKETIKPFEAYIETARNLTSNDAKITKQILQLVASVFEATSVDIEENKNSISDLVEAYKIFITPLEAKTTEKVEANKKKLIINRENLVKNAKTLLVNALSSQKVLDNASNLISNETILKELFELMITNEINAAIKQRDEKNEQTLTDEEIAQATYQKYQPLAARLESIFVGDNNLTPDIVELISSSTLALLDDSIAIGSELQYEQILINLLVNAENYVNPKAVQKPQNKSSGVYTPESDKLPNEYNSEQDELSESDNKMSEARKSQTPENPITKLVDANYGLVQIITQALPFANQVLQNDRSVSTLQKIITDERVLNFASDYMPSVKKLDIGILTPRLLLLFGDITNILKDINLIQSELTEINDNMGMFDFGDKSLFEQDKYDDVKYANTLRLISETRAALIEIFKSPDIVENLGAILSDESMFDLLAENFIKQQIDLAVENDARDINNNIKRKVAETEVNNRFGATISRLKTLIVEQDNLTPEVMQLFVNLGLAALNDKSEQSDLEIAKQLLAITDDANEFLASESSKLPVDLVINALPILQRVTNNDELSQSFTKILANKDLLDLIGLDDSIKEILSDTKLTGRSANLIKGLINDLDEDQLKALIIAYNKLSDPIILSDNDKGKEKEDDVKVDYSKVVNIANDILSSYLQKKTLDTFEPYEQPIDKSKFTLTPANILNDTNIIRSVIDLVNIAEDLSNEQVSSLVNDIIEFSDSINNDEVKKQLENIKDEDLRDQKKLQLMLQSSLNFLNRNFATISIVANSAYLRSSLMTLVESRIVNQAIVDYLSESPITITPIKGKARKKKETFTDKVRAEFKPVLLVMLGSKNVKSLFEPIFDLVTSAVNSIETSKTGKEYNLLFIINNLLKFTEVENLKDKEKISLELISPIKNLVNSLLNDQIISSISKFSTNLISIQEFKNFVDNTMPLLLIESLENKKTKDKNKKTKELLNNVKGNLSLLFDSQLITDSFGVIKGLSNVLEVNDLSNLIKFYYSQEAQAYLNDEDESAKIPDNIGAVLLPIINKVVSNPTLKDKLSLMLDNKALNEFMAKSFAPDSLIYRYFIWLKENFLNITITLNVVDKVASVAVQNQITHFIQWQNNRNIIQNKFNKEKDSDSSFELYCLLKECDKNYIINLIKSEKDISEISEALKAISSPFTQVVNNNPMFIDLMPLSINNLQDIMSNIVDLLPKIAKSQQEDILIIIDALFDKHYPIDDKLPDNIDKLYTFKSGDDAQDAQKLASLRIAVDVLNDNNANEDIRKIMLLIFKDIGEKPVLKTTQNMSDDEKLKLIKNNKTREIAPQVTLLLNKFSDNKHLLQIARSFADFILADEILKLANKKLSNEKKELNSPDFKAKEEIIKKDIANKENVRVEKLNILVQDVTDLLRDEKLKDTLNQNRNLIIELLQDYIAPPKLIKLSESHGVSFPTLVSILIEEPRNLTSLVELWTNLNFNSENVSRTKILRNSVTTVKKLGTTVAKTLYNSESLPSVDLENILAQKRMSDTQINMAELIENYINEVSKVDNWKIPFLQHATFDNKKAKYGVLNFEYLLIDKFLHGTNFSVCNSTIKELHFNGSYVRNFDITSCNIGKLALNNSNIDKLIFKNKKIIIEELYLKNSLIGFETLIALLKTNPKLVKIENLFITTDIGHNVKDFDLILKYIPDLTQLGVPKDKCPNLDNLLNKYSNKRTPESISLDLTNKVFASVSDPKTSGHALIRSEEFIAFNNVLRNIISRYTNDEQAAILKNKEDIVGGPIPCRDTLGFTYTGYTALSNIRVGLRDKKISITECESKVCDFIDSKIGKVRSPASSLQKGRQ